MMKTLSMPIAKTRKGITSVMMRVAGIPTAAQKPTAITEQRRRRRSKRKGGERGEEGKKK
jgi:hypothetical protein